VVLSDQTTKACVKTEIIENWNVVIYKLGLGDITAVVWKDKWEVYMLTNTYNPLAESNFSDEHGSALNLSVVHGHGLRNFSSTL
jgi:hypothetical protein